MASPVVETASTAYPFSSRAVRIVNCRAGSSSTKSRFFILMSFRSGRYGDGSRENESKARPHPGLAGDFDLSPVLFDDLLDDGEPDSGACFSRFFRLFG